MSHQDNVGPKTVAAMTPADNVQADPVLQSPSNALLDVSDLCRPNNRGGLVEASLPVFDRMVLLHQWHLRRQLWQRGRMLGKGCHDGVGEIQAGASLFITTTLCVVNSTGVCQKHD